MNIRILSLHQKICYWSQGLSKSFTRLNHATYFELRIVKYPIRFSDCYSKQFDGQVVKKGEQALLPMITITILMITITMHQ